MIRCTHNPCGEALLDACYKYDMYVMDEIFDMWYMHKKKYYYASDFEDCFEQDILAMCIRIKIIRL